MAFPSVFRPRGAERTGNTRGSGGPVNVAWHAHADVIDQGTCYEVRMTIHGVLPDRLTVEVRDNVLIVEGRRESGPYAPSREASDFHRIIGLPPDVAHLGATARLESELLVIRIPKTRGGSGSTLQVEHPDTSRGGL